MKNHDKNKKLSEHDIKKLQDEVVELREILVSIQAGEIDALIVKNKSGDESVFTLEGEDQPYRLLVESLSEGALTIDSKGVIIHCNNKFAMMVNDSVKNIIGTLFTKYFPDSQLKKLKDLISGKSAKANQEQYTLLVVGKTDKIVLLSINSINLGRVGGVSIVVTDITQLSNEFKKRIKIQKKLSEQETLFRRLSENINDVFWVMNAKRDKILFVSQGYETVWGRSIKSIYEHPMEWLDSVVDQDKAKVMEFLDCLGDHEYASVNYRIISVDGVHKYLFVKGYQNKDEHGNVIDIYGVVTDVTELTTITNQLHLHDKLSVIGSLAAGVAHEINNPISWIRGNLSYVKKNSAKIDGIKLEELMNESIEGVDRIIEIARNLKGFSRINDNELTEVDLHTVLESALKIASPEMKLHARLEINYADKLPAIKANGGKLQQVFLNLIMNAIQAMSRETMESNVLSVSTVQETKRIRVDITDTGSGIKPEDIPKLFDPFFTTKSKDEGTGIGLSISYEIIKQHGGEIKVKSKLGKGTTFSVYLPMDLPTVTQASPGIG